MDTSFFVAITIAVVVIIVLIKTAVIVPQQNAFVVERLGKFSGKLDAGFHILVPFFDKIAYKHTLKEQAVDIPEQICITTDNVQVASLVFTGLKQRIVNTILMRRTWALCPK